MASKKEAKKNSIKKEQKNKKEVPNIIKAISILFYTFAVFSLISGIALFILAIAGESLMHEMGILEAIKKNSEKQGISFEEARPYLRAAFASMSLLFITLAIFEAIIARGIWKGKNWARISGIILMILFLIQAILSLNLVLIVLSIVTGGYLWFAPESKSTFAKEKNNSK